MPKECCFKCIEFDYKGLALPLPCVNNISATNGQVILDLNTGGVFEWSDIVNSWIIILPAPQDPWFFLDEERGKIYEVVHCTKPVLYKADECSIVLDSITGDLLQLHDIDGELTWTLECNLDFSSSNSGPIGPTGPSIDLFTQEITSSNMGVFSADSVYSVALKPTVEGSSSLLSDFYSNVKIGYQESPANIKIQNDGLDTVILTANNPIVVLAGDLT